MQLWMTQTQQSQDDIEPTANNFEELGHVNHFFP